MVTTKPSSQEIDNYINQILQLNFKRAEFKNLSTFLTHLNIHYKPKIITVTGTNGKGSTVALISEVFKHNQIDHICHISPHLHVFNERISHNQKSIDDEALCFYLQKIYQASVELKLQLHYHFIAFLCAWLHIEQQRPQWAILEVGVGGKLDPANLFDADIAIITTVALDHCELLGHSLEEIALNKVHIARSDKPVIVGEPLPYKAQDYLNEIKATIIAANPVSQHLMESSGIHPTSLACALTAIKEISPTLCLPNNLHQLAVPGRFCIVSKNPLIITDIAHNPQAVQNLMLKIAKLKNKFKRTIAIFTVHQNKDISQILEDAQLMIDLWLIPDLSGLDVRFKQLKDEQQTNYFSENTLFFDNHIEAFKYVQHNAQLDDLIVVFGSFVLVGAFIEYYDKK